MMNEEIKKLIEEEAREYAFQQYKDDEFTETILFNETINVFKAGASLILSKWQEANRWRKVSEEMPELDKAVLCRMKNPNVIVEGFIYNDNGLARITTQPDFEFEDYADGEVTEWKPIE